ncbi:MAG: cytochrome c-type biogenesis protein CcmH [Chloroflexi bacterium]|nr:cytochrome c-type biogenesis protein CcmH [Chloroflexota bacterium]
MAAAAGMRNLRRHAPLIVVGVLFVLFVLATACSSKERTVEERGNALDRQLICPICPGETIDQAQVQIAKDMRKIVREKLANGEDEKEIKDFFVARYGLSVLASPPASGFNLLIWIVPPIGLAGALGALYLVLREMSRRGSVPAIAGGNAAMDATDEALAPYLEAVDREMLQIEAEAEVESGLENDTLSSQTRPENEGGSGMKL